MINKKLNVIDVLEDLEATSGRNDKETILRKHVKNALLKKVFSAAQDPYVVYYVNKFKMPEPANVSGDESDMRLERFLTQALPQLSARMITGNAAKNFVNATFSSLNELEQKWFLRIILKNLRAGVQGSTLNKIWPDLIPSFDVQLANVLATSFSKNDGIIIEDEIDYPVRVEPKLDGLRCIAIKNNGTVTMFTRSGSLIETLPKIKAALEGAAYDNIVLDGEAMGADWNESASIVMSHKKHKDDANITYNVFDAIPYIEWISHTSSVKLRERVSYVDDIVKTIGSPMVVHVPGETVRSEAELMKFYESVMDKGYEGIMVKDLGSPYIFKRSDAILKMKPVTTYEGMVIDHYEGRRGSRREGQWGGFEVILSNGVITRVGGGFNDVFRAEVQLNSPDSYVGKIIEIEGQPDPLTKDGLTADGKVRFPVFIRFRDRSDVDRLLVTVGDAYLEALKE